MERGIVVRNTGSWYLVETDGGETVECKIKGSFRLKGIRNTNPVAIGDRVEIERNESGTAFIREIAARKNYIIRKSSNLSKEAHILAANIDQALLVVSFTRPETHLEFIDRFLATAEAYRVPVRILINKTDSYDSEQQAYADAVAALYESVGYGVLQLSARTGAGMDAVEALLPGRITLLSGNSGVGKSTLINRILPGLGLRTAAVSASHHKGMHTTTFSEMFPVPGGGYLIDTPGVKGFGTIDFKSEEVPHYFPEIFRESQACRFGNCTHVHEPGCAVLKAVAEHRISESRYASYRSILEDGTDGKYRVGH